jgi:ATP synthase protein I
MSKESGRGPQAASGLGFVLVAVVVLFTAAGYGLDRWLHTKPWLMVAGVFVGFALGFTYLVLMFSGDGPGGRLRKKNDGNGKGSDDGSA